MSFQRRFAFYFVSLYTVYERCNDVLLFLKAALTAYLNRKSVESLKSTPSHTFECTFFFFDDRQIIFKNQRKYPFSLRVTISLV